MKAPWPGTVFKRNLINLPAHVSVLVLSIILPYFSCSGSSAKKGIFARG